jgi:hypothetical protein
MRRGVWEYGELGYRVDVLWVCVVCLIVTYKKLNVYGKGYMIVVGSGDIYSCRGLPREDSMKRFKLKKHQLERLHEIQYSHLKEKERRERDIHPSIPDKTTPTSGREKI